MVPHWIDVVNNWYIENIISTDTMSDVVNWAIKNNVIQCIEIGAYV